MTNIFLTDITVFALTPLTKRPNRGCTSFVNWKSSTYHKRRWLSLTQLLLSWFCALL